MALDEGSAGGEGVRSGLRRACRFLWFLAIGECKQRSRQQLSVQLLYGSSRWREGQAGWGWCGAGGGGGRDAAQVEGGGGGRDEKTMSICLNLQKFDKIANGSQR